MKILMICLGNICRSPLAEGILKTKIEQRGLENWSVDSAGIGGWHEGQLPDRRSIAVDKKHGVDLTAQRARQVKTSDFEQFDLVFAMDKSNARDLQRLARTEAERSKIRLILEEKWPASGREVPDPYYGEAADFEAVFQLLDAACAAFLEKTA